MDHPTGLKAPCRRVTADEVDHLHGTLFIDHLSSLKRALYKKKLKKILREEA